MLCLPFANIHRPTMIIHSLLDTDLYKFTMMQVVLHQLSGVQVEYKFKYRNPGVQRTLFGNHARLPAMRGSA